MPEPARKVEEVKVTITVKKRREERARAFRESREQDRRRLAEHMTAPHMAGIGGVPPAREGGKPSAEGGETAPPSEPESQPAQEGQPAGQTGAQPEAKPEGAPEDGKAPEEGKPEEGKG